MRSILSITVAAALCTSDKGETLKVTPIAYTKLAMPK